MRVEREDGGGGGSKGPYVRLVGHPKEGCWSARMAETGVAMRWLPARHC